jgi:hypothetical protein
MEEEHKELCLTASTSLIVSSNNKNTAIILRGGGFHGSAVLGQLQELRDDIRGSRGNSNSAGHDDDVNNNNDKGDAVDYFVWDDSENLHPSFSDIERLRVGTKEGDNADSSSLYLNRALANIMLLRCTLL